MGKKTKKRRHRVSVKMSCFTGLQSVSPQICFEARSAVGFLRDPLWDLYCSLSYVCLVLYFDMGFLIIFQDVQIFIGTALFQ